MYVYNMYQGISFLPQFPDVGETDNRNRGESNTTWMQVVRVCPGTGHGNLLVVPLHCLVQW